MRSARVIVESVNIVALGLWSGSLALVGVAAAFAFPTMRDLDPALPAYQAYDGDHWSLAAGAVMNPLFGTVSIVGRGALLVTTVTIALLLWRKWSSWSARSFQVRFWVWLALMLLTLSVDRALWTPMDELFRAHLEAAQTGDSTRCAEIMAAFDALHSRASALMGAQLLMIVGALVTGVINALASVESERA